MAWKPTPSPSALAGSPEAKRALIWNAVTDRLRIITEETTFPPEERDALFASATDASACGAGSFPWHARNAADRDPAAGSAGPASALKPAPSTAKVEKPPIVLYAPANEAISGSRLASCLRDFGGTDA